MPKICKIVFGFSRGACPWKFHLVSYCTYLLKAFSSIGTLKLLASWCFLLILLGLSFCKICNSTMACLYKKYGCIVYPNLNDIVGLHILCSICIICRVFGICLLRTVAGQDWAQFSSWFSALSSSLCFSISTGKLFSWLPSKFWINLIALNLGNWTYAIACKQISIKWVIILWTPLEITTRFLAIFDSRKCFLGIKNGQKVLQAKIDGINRKDLSIYTMIEDCVLSSSSQVKSFWFALCFYQFLLRAGNFELSWTDLPVLNMQEDLQEEERFQDSLSLATRIVAWKFCK